MTVCPVCRQEPHRRVCYDAHTPPSGVAQRARRGLHRLLRALPAGLPLPPSLALHAGSPFGGVVRVCAGCGHAVMLTVPDAAGLQRYYGRRYWGERPAQDGHGAQRGQSRAVAQVELVRGCRLQAGLPGLPDETLEIGAAWAGATLRFRELAGPAVRTAVCEPGEHWSAHYAEHGIERLGAYYPFRSPRTFDHIHTSHWLEHVADLETTRRALLEHLQPGGTLFIEVPNCGAPYWDLDLADHPHIHFFSATSLRRAFTDLGLQCLHCLEYGMSLEDRAAGVRPAAEQHTANPGGIWLRAVFLKPGRDA